MLFVAKDEKNEGWQKCAVLGAAALSHLNAIWALCVCFLFEISIFSIHNSVSFQCGEIQPAKEEQACLDACSSFPVEAQSGVTHAE